MSATASALQSRRFALPGIAGLCVIALVLVVGFCVLYPLAMLVIGSVTPYPAGSGEGLNLDGFRVALGDERARYAMWTTLWLAVVRSIAAVSIAILFAWAVNRTDVPGKRVFHWAMMISFFAPSLPSLVAWSLLASPRSGLINVWLRQLLGISGHSGPFNIYSYGGIIFVGSMSWAAFLYLFIAPAFRALDASMEEAAKMSGASSFQVLRRISVPLLLPAILGAVSLAFIRMLESFETELFLGTPAGITVFSTQIYAYINTELTPRWQPAIAMSVVFILVIAAVIIAESRMLGGRSFVTVTGKGQRRTPINLGWRRYLLLAVLSLYVFIDLILPMTILLLGSLQQSTIAISLKGFTLSHWRYIANPSMIEAIWNTLVIGVVGATVGIMLMAVISYVVVRTRFRLRRVLDVLTWVPYLVPSFVLGVGFLWAALNGIKFPFQLYGTKLLLIIALIVRQLPLNGRLMNGTMHQIGQELEEAARMSGASWLATFRRIVLPLLRPALVIGWLVVMMVAIRDLSTVIMLYGPSSTTLAVKFFAAWRTGSPEDAAAIGVFMTLLGLSFAAGIVLVQRIFPSVRDPNW